MVDEAFDDAPLRLMQADDDHAGARFAVGHVCEAGNGAEQISLWITSMGAAADLPFRWRYDRAVAG